MGFLDKLLGRRTEPEEIEIAFPDIPEWISEKERAIHEEADGAVRESRPRVLEALREMQETIDTLKGAVPDENEVLHPKLLRVVEQGVPRYASAMEKTLSLSVSEVPGEYYDNCVELISQIAKNTKGPGRYIANVFPAEMKELRIQTDVIGREVNAISGVLSKTREQSSWVDGAREMHTEILAGKSRLSESEHRAVELAEKNASMDTELTVLKKNLQDYLEGSESVEYDRLMAKKALYEGKLRGADDDYNRIISRSANVFRKAVHACELSGDSETITLLNTVRNGLESRSSEDRKKGLAAYPSIFPRLARMIRENEGLIKNKDEMSLFSEQDAFVVPLTDAIALTDEMNALCAQVEDELNRLPFVGNKIAMEKKIHVLTEEIAANSSQITDNQDNSDEIRASFPEMAEKLKLNLEHLAGEGGSLIVTQLPDFS